MTAVEYILYERPDDSSSSSLIIPGGIDGLKSSIRRDRMRRDPALWIRQRLREVPWSKQRDICASVVANRYTIVPSCFGPGKSWLSARIGLWWLDIHRVGEAFLVTTAATAQQVRAILWKEIHIAHERGKLPGRLNQTEIYMTRPDSGNEQLVGFGRKPSDTVPSAAQGIHAEKVLVIMDEAPGIVKLLFESYQSLVINDNSRLLALGNPEESGTPFANALLPGSGWSVIKISAFDTPAFTGESVLPIVSRSLISRIWVEERRKRWGEHSPMWRNKVLAEVVEDKESGLIKPSWVRAAQNRGDEFINPESQIDVHDAHAFALEHALSRDLAPAAPITPRKSRLRAIARPPAYSTPSHARLYPLLCPRHALSTIVFESRFSFGVDVGEGRDKSTIALFDAETKFGAIIHRSTEPNPMMLLGSIVEFAKLWRPESIFVDSIGVGSGVAGQAKLESDTHSDILTREIYKRIKGIKVSESAADDKEYVNLRAYACWENSALFRDGTILLDSQDDEISSQCLMIEYFRNGGKIQIKSKADIRRDNEGRSPDDYDALVLATMRYLGVMSRAKKYRRRGLTWKPNTA